MFPHYALQKTRHYERSQKGISCSRLSVTRHFPWILSSLLGNEQWTFIAMKQKLIYDNIVDSGLLVTILFYRSLGNLNIEKGNFLKTSFIKFIIMILYRFVRYTLNSTYNFPLKIFFFRSKAIKFSDKLLIYNKILILTYLMYHTDWRQLISLYWEWMRSLWNKLRRRLSFRQLLLIIWPAKSSGGETRYIWILYIRVQKW